MRTYDDTVARRRAEHGDRFSEADLVPRFVRYFDTGQRIKVTDRFEFTRTGTVGITTGWRPAFLLMHRSNAIGSWDLLSEHDEIVAVRIGRRYEEVTA